MRDCGHSETRFSSSGVVGEKSRLREAYSMSPFRSRRWQCTKPLTTERHSTPEYPRRIVFFRKRFRLLACHTSCQIANGKKIQGTHKHQTHNRFQ